MRPISERKRLSGRLVASEWYLVPGRLRRMTLRAELERFERAHSCWVEAVFSQVSPDAKNPLARS